MTSNTPEAQEFDALMEVLDHVRLALKTGDYDSLEKSAQDQNRLITGLENRPSNKQLTELQARKLSKSALHNQRMIGATLAGLRSAKRRKEDIRKAENESRIYDRSGHSQRLNDGNVKVEKRR